MAETNMSQDFAGIDQAVPLSALLGYLNFSEGKPDPRFQKQFHDAFVYVQDHGSAAAWKDLPALLLARLPTLQQSGSAAFSDITQADAVLRLAFDHVLPAYRTHHR